MKKIGFGVMLAVAILSCTTEKSNEIDQFLDRMDFLINQYDKELGKSILDEEKLSGIVKEIESIDIEAEEKFGDFASDKQVKRYQELVKRLDKVIEKEEQILEREFEKE